MDSNTPTAAADYQPRLGEIVLYRTRPCKDPDTGPDLDAYSNYARSSRMEAIDRPALVVRVWPDRNLNLRVYADAGEDYDLWRQSVPPARSADARAAGYCWQPRPPAGDAPEPSYT